MNSLQQAVQRELDRLHQKHCFPGATWPMFYLMAPWEGSPAAFQIQRLKSP